MMGSVGFSTIRSTTCKDYWTTFTIFSTYLNFYWITAFSIKT